MKLQLTLSGPGGTSQVDVDSDDPTLVDYGFDVEQCIGDA